MSLGSGTRLGPYEVLSPLGAGGMGEVYRARDVRLERSVAIKVLPGGVTRSPEAGARLDREARSIAALSHPNICALYDVGHQDGTDYLVFELIEGETLAARLERGALPADELVDIGIQIARALAAAHSVGIVHRDLKPGNVMLTRAGAKLMDFGLARGVGVSPASGSGSIHLSQSPTVAQAITREGSIVGTFQYMSPEQAEGKEADARSDLFALGAVLYEMATGLKAFKGTSQASLIAAILREHPRPIAEIVPLAPRALDRIVRACLAKDPGERWQSAADLATALGWVRDADSAAGAGAGVHSSPLSQVSFRALTFRRGSIGAARFTLDGRAVVYNARWAGGPSRVFLGQLDSPDATELPLPDADLLGVSRTGQLALSLDRRMRVGDWDTSGLLAQAPQFGGVPREISRNVHLADWGPDGRSLAVVRREGLESRIEYPIGNVILSSPDWKSVIRVSPDGNLVLFAIISPDDHKICITDRNGHVRVIARPKSWPNGVAWSEDGREVWYGEYGGADGPELHAIHLETGRDRVVQRFMSGAVALHDRAPNGDFLLTRTSLYVSINCLAPGMDAERELSWLDLTIAKDFSDDGRRLLFDEQGLAVEREPQTYIRPTDGSPAVRLGRGLARGLSPDGRWASVADRGTLTLLPTGAGEPRVLDIAPLTLGGIANWFPDGRRLLMSGSEPGRGARLYEVPLDGGRPRPLTPEGIAFPSGAMPKPVSCDGTRVMAIAPGNEVVIYDVVTGERLAAHALDPDEDPLRWHIDGHSVFTWARGRLPIRLQRLDLSTGRREPWRELSPALSTGVTWCRTVFLTSDGSHYAYTFSRMLSELYLLRGLS